MIPSGNFPTSYRGILRLAKKIGVKLTPTAVMSAFEYNQEACVLTMLAVVNNLENHIFVRALDQKFEALEAGFEDYWYKLDGEAYPHFDNSVFRRYYKVGERLRQYAATHES